MTPKHAPMAVMKAAQSNASQWFVQSCASWHTKPWSIMTGDMQRCCWLGCRKRSHFSRYGMNNRVTPAFSCLQMHVWIVVLLLPGVLFSLCLSHYMQSKHGHCVQGWSGKIREPAGRASQARTHTPPDWVAALIQTDGPKDGSSVSIMVSLQIIYISPLLLFCPQAHEASFSMLLLAGRDERAIQRVVLWVVEGCKNRRTRPHTCTVRLHRAYRNSAILAGTIVQLTKCCWGELVWDICTSHEPFHQVLSVSIMG